VGHREDYSNSKCKMQNANAVTQSKRCNMHTLG
jgi:hypothetical protein